MVFRLKRSLSVFLLFGFWGPLSVPALAMEDVFHESSFQKPRSMAAMPWLQSLEVKRDQAEKNRHSRILEGLTREISATLAGKYGLSDRQATDEERLMMLGSVIKTRKLFQDTQEILDTFYFGYDPSSCWGKVGKDQTFTTHMGVIAATDYLSFDVFKGGNRFHIGEPSKFGARLPQQLTFIIAQTIPQVQTVYRAALCETLLKSLKPGDWSSLVTCADRLLAKSKKTPSKTSASTPYVLKIVQGHPLSHMQEAEAQISYSFLPQTVGNMLSVVDGKLTITCPESEENEDKLRELYQELNEAIQGGMITPSQFTLTSKTIQNGAARCVGGKGLRLTASQSFLGDHTLFGSQGAIEFCSPVFDFSSCFVDVNVAHTIITITPPDSLNSPIEYFRILPKRTPLFIQGSLDFRTLSFKDFLVSHAALQIKFK